ncbi:MAG: DUF4240 domain-containing protein [Gammaproteobacteria bacterium]
MNSKQFWALIDAARQQAGTDMDARVDALQDLLSPLDAHAIAAFQRHYDAQRLRAHRWDLWGAAYLIHDGCDHDGFRHFCDWLLSEGREVFEATLRDPDSLAERAPPRGVALELFGYVALAVHEQKFRQALVRDTATDIALPMGEEWTEAELPVLFPRLAHRYW